MIVMNLKLNNVLSFSNFNINFSYPMKLRKSTIDDECLENIPSFRYKKVNIFVGANASGKTSLIKCIWKILLFLDRKEKNIIDELINRKYNESYFEIDFVEIKYVDNVKKYILNRIKIKSNNVEDSLLIAKAHVDIKNGDSYESLVNLLDSAVYEFSDYNQFLSNNLFNTGWNTLLPATEQGFDRLYFIKTNNEVEKNMYLDTLKNVLFTFDSSILDVKYSKDTDDAVVLEHENFDKIIIQSGNKLSDIRYLSSGTKYAFNIANTLYSIKKHMHGIYLIDEQFSYVSSDVEIATLVTMVSVLGHDEQIFFTTHNTNILEIRFPFHSFYFISKKIIEGRTTIICQCASIVENRNNVVPKSILDNDILSTAPDISLIYELGEDYEEKI